MNADRLFALYDHVADAPDAVVRLRRFVLDLAVRGKLVEQDPADEPASELLRQITIEKARMVKAGEIRKPRKLSNGEDLVPPYDVPVTWCWRRLDTIGAIVGGGTPSAGDPTNFSEPGEGIPWLTPKDLGGYDVPYIERGSRDLSEKGLQSSSATLMPVGTVLFSSRAPIGYVAIAANPVATNQGFKSVVPYVAECSRYIALAMRAFAPGIESSARGTTFKEVSGKIIAGTPFPLAPLGEQRRIVAKVDSLMALCDRLEEARGARHGTRELLTKASLTRLTAPHTDARKLRSHARFAVDSLCTLTARADQLKYMRHTILSLAVCGKLVEQDRADETASKLLEQVAEHRKTRGVPAPESLPGRGQPIESAEMPRDLPGSWVWASLGDITISRDRERVPVSKAERQTRAKLYDYYGASGVIDKIDGYLFDKPLLLIGEDGANLINRSKPIAFIARGKYWVNNHAHVLDGISEDFLRFLALSINATDLRPFVTGTAQPKMNQKKMNSIPVALPPLAEQLRIVAKVDQLMALCDRLQNSLEAADGTRNRLLESLLQEPLAPAEL